MADSQKTQDNSVMAKEFDKETRQQLAEEDSNAWRSVTGLLIAIICIGLLIAVVAIMVAS
jgi:hypothetical protein